MGDCLTCPAKYKHRMNCHLYILGNPGGRHYVGITGLDLDKRVKKHNRGEVMSTKFGRPWQVLYSENYKDYGEARKREKEIKSWKGGNSFKKLLRIAAGSSNGRTSPFEGEYLGSIPSPAAIRRSKLGGVK